MYNQPLVPDNFDVPELLETGRMRLRPLTIGDAVKDFDAVISSEVQIKRLMEPTDDWPVGLTLEQNIIEMGWHQTEFQLRTSFAYTVVAHDESQVLGCMYIYPCSRAGHDVEVPMWVRDSEADTGLDEHLFETVKNWIDSAWPFKNPAYPGHEIDWKSWRQL